MQLGQSFRSLYVIAQVVFESLPRDQVIAKEYLGRLFESLRPNLKTVHAFLHEYFLAMDLSLLVKIRLL